MAQKKQHDFVQENTLIRIAFPQGINEISSEDWFKCLFQELRAKKHDLMKILPFVGNGEKVNREKFNNFLKWFSPIESEDIYKENSSQSSLHTFSSIASLFSKDWFHGFISSEEAEYLLAGEPRETFLIRFGSEPPRFALTVRARLGDDKTVSIDNPLCDHWRIFRTGNRFLLYEEQFDSLDGIIDKYSKTLIKDGVCYLKRPCPKPPRLLTDPIRPTPGIKEIKILYILSSPLGTLRSGTLHGNHYLGLEFPSMKQKHWLDDRLISEIRHPKLLSIFGFNDAPFQIFFEQWGTVLKDCYKSNELLTMHRLFILQDISSGLEYLSSLKINHLSVHGLLNLHSIYISKEPDTNYFTAKIGFYGIHRLYYTYKDETEFTWGFPSSWYSWLAPECVIELPNRFSPKCDSWAFGLLIYALIERVEPLLNFTYEELYKYYRDNISIFVHLQRSKSDWLQEQVNLVPLIQHCLMQDPEKRKPIEDLHKEFQSLIPLRKNNYGTNESVPKTIYLQEGAEYVTDLSNDPENLKLILEWLRDHNLSKFANNREFIDYLSKLEIAELGDLYDMDLPNSFQDMEKEEFRTRFRYEYLIKHLIPKKDIAPWAKVCKINSLSQSLSDLAYELEHVQYITEADLKKMNITDPEMIKKFMKAQQELIQFLEHKK